MSSVVRPSGRHPARIYWVRRLLLLAIACTMIWAIVHVVGGDPEPSAVDDDVVPAQTAAPKAPAKSSPTKPVKSKAPDTKNKKDTKKKAKRPAGSRVQSVTAEFGTASTTCTPERTLVEPEVIGQPYSGSTTVIHLRLTSLAPESCSLQLDPQSLLVEISAGDQTAWTSLRCQGAIPSEKVVLHPYWTASVDMLWSGLRSNRECTPDEPGLDPGEYTVHAAFLGGEPTEGQLQVISETTP